MRFLPRKNFIKDEEGVSETVGFIIVLAIIMLAISIVYGAAIPMVISAEETQYLKNVENAMVTLAYNANRIALGSAPSQSVEVKTRGAASLSFTGRSTFNVSWYNDSRGRNYLNTTLLTIEHQLDNKKLAYEGGGVWGDWAGKSVVISRPRPRFSFGNVTTLPVVAKSGANSSVGGTQVAHVDLENTCRSSGQCVTTMSEAVNATDITLGITSTYCNGWKKYFTDELGFNNLSGTPTHFEDWDCSDNQMVANVSKFLGWPRNVTLYILYPAVEGKVQ
ncbi:MAG: hypothetical protein HY558_02190 [Euryarchaeota archaeon]|nr:hypothetical protein [Euryarchaeota archaeon]